MIDVGTFREKWSFLAEKEVFIACSGGVDSMVLTHLVKQLNPKITLLHVNYNLRGSDSLQDENLIHDYASKEGLPFEIHSVHLDTKSNLQENARKIRYAWFAEKVKSENAVLLLGHHEDDQLETFYLNLARKSGNTGMACMPETHGKIIRPLLSYSKRELYDFARKSHLVWREDISNLKNEYARNRLRNEFLPLLEQEIPGLKDSVLFLIGVFQENKKSVEKSVELVIANIRKNHILELNVWRGLTVEQRIYILKSIGYTHRQLVEVEKLEMAQKGKTVSSPDCTIIREEDYFSFKFQVEETTKPKLLVEIVRELPQTFSKQEIYLDASKISGKLRLRKWKTGDRISPIGIKGSQLISDIITDAKIPNAQRKKIYIIEDEENIHWCIGLKIGRLAVADEFSERILQVKIIYS